jgi:rhodanese-related sulfurtransferase
MKPVPQPISAATAERRRGAGALLVDVRPQVARHQGTIDDALLVEPAAITDRFKAQPVEVDYNREIVVCSISSHRAIPAAERLSRLGYRHVYYLSGGYTAWQNRHTAR